MRWVLKEELQHLQSLHVRKKSWSTCSPCMFRKSCMFKKSCSTCSPCMFGFADTLAVLACLDCKHLQSLHVWVCSPCKVKGHANWRASTGGGLGAQKPLSKSETSGHPSAAGASKQSGRHHCIEAVQVNFGGERQLKQTGG